MLINPTLLLWLNYQSSLTEKLRASTGDARLELLAQEWMKASMWDKAKLNLSEDLIFCRQIVMYTQQIACWYARTIIPYSSYHSNSNLFKRLKYETLGALIFNNSQIERTRFLTYSIDPNDIEYQWLPKKLATAKSLWMRLSEFKIDHQYIFFLIEILLPGLTEESN